MYTAINNDFHLPADINSNLKIQELLHNEGTKKYTKIEIKKGIRNVMKTNDETYIYENSSINMIDTRGQILLDEKEKEKINLCLDGKVKNMSDISSRNYRYAYL